VGVMAEAGEAKAFIPKTLRNFSAPDRAKFTSPS
jgi:hypothetical protein